MTRLPAAVVFALGCAFWAGSAAPPGGAAPGGQFERRLRAAEQGKRIAPRRPAAHEKLRRPARRSGRPTVKPLRPVAPRPGSGLSTSTTPNPFNPGTVSHSIDSRPDRSARSSETGDLALFTEPGDVPVHYYWEGGFSLAGDATTIKGLKPGTVRIMAYAPSIRGRAAVTVPLKANCLTTVRFTFPDPRTAQR
jgi:hypothetical protein